MLKLETNQAKAWCILTASSYYRGGNQLRNRSFWLWWTRFHRGRNADSTAANAQVVLSGTVDNFYTNPTLAEIFVHTDTLRANRKGVPVMMKSAKTKLAECFYAKKAPCLHYHGKKRSHRRTRLILITGSRTQMINHTWSNGQLKSSKTSLPLRSEHGRSGPLRSNGGLCWWRATIS